jgi:ribonuclease Z
MLGTASPIHQPHRFGPSQVISGGGVNILVDPGWGSTLRLFQSGITPQRIDAVFVTHLHSDHTTDFADFLVMGWVGGRSVPVPVYGPVGTARTVAGYQQALEADTKYRLDHHGDKLSPIGPAAAVTEISAGEEPVAVARIGEITVKAFHVDHRPVMPAYGYRFERGGASIVISGDTNACPGLLNGSQGAHILVCDSMNKRMMKQVEERLRSIGNEVQASLLEDAHNYHASVEDGAEIAQEAGVKHLVMSHLLPSITNEQVPEFTAGLDKIFSGKISVAKDLDHFVAG